MIKYLVLCVLRAYCDTKVATNRGVHDAHGALIFMRLFFRPPTPSGFRFGRRQQTLLIFNIGDMKVFKWFGK